MLVTGAEGFVGRALVRLLERSDQRVISLDSIQPAVTKERSTTTKIGCDITNQQQLEKVFRDYEIGTIVHLAAILPTAAQRDPVRATRMNVIGSVNLLELARLIAIGGDGLGGTTGMQHRPRDQFQLALGG